MNVKQLRGILANMPDDALVVLAQDAEGNAFSLVGSYNTNKKYLPDRPVAEGGNSRGNAGWV
jgi:hypothetical protein